MTSRRTLLLAVGAVVLLTAAMLPVRPAAGFVDLFGRAVVQTIVNIDRRGDAYERIEAARDEALAAVDAEAGSDAGRLAAGSMSQEDFDAEEARRAQLRAALVARAEREKAMNRATYNRAIGSEWRTAAEAAVVTGLTGGGYAATLYGQLRRGEDPLSGALQTFAGDRLAALLQAPATERVAAADQLNRALGALDVVRDPKGQLRSTVRELESILRTGEGELPAVLSAQATATAQSLMAQWQQVLGQWQHLTASQVRVSTERLLRDQRWATLTAEILRLGSVPIANRATLATRVGIVQDRVSVALEGQDVDVALRASLVVRVLAEVLRVEQERAAGVPVVLDLDAFVQATLAELRSATTTTTAAPDTTAMPDAEPSEDAGRPTGGGVYVVDDTTPDAVTPGPMCLSVRQLPSSPGGQVLMLEGCATAVRHQTVFDLAEGTVSGWFEADLACPGESCGTWYTSTGTVRGEYGPLPYGQPPTEVPDGWPFPDDHWYGANGTYWAGGPIELAIELTGDYEVGDGTKVPSSWSTTVTGWVSSELSWGAKAFDQPKPTSWYGSLGVSIDQGQDADPRWYFYLGINEELPETNLTLPPWEE